MAKLWRYESDVDLAIQVIEIIYTKHRKLPEALVQAYWATISQAEPRGLVYFYEQLGARAPEALHRYFISEPIDLKTTRTAPAPHIVAKLQQELGLDSIEDVLKRT